MELSMGAEGAVPHMRRDSTRSTCRASSRTCGSIWALGLATSDNGPAGCRMQGGQGGQSGVTQHQRRHTGCFPYSERAVGQPRCTAQQAPTST
jgi:hypothetical protein